MKFPAILLLAGAILLLGCTQQQPAAMPDATNTQAAMATAQATATALPTVDISQAEQELGDAANELSDMEDATAGLDETDLNITDDELDALG